MDSALVTPNVSFPDDGEVPPLSTAAITLGGSCGLSSSPTPASSDRSLVNVTVTIPAGIVSARSWEPRSSNAIACTSVGLAFGAGIAPIETGGKLNPTSGISSIGLTSSGDAPGNIAATKASEGRRTTPPDNSPDPSSRMTANS